MPTSPVVYGSAAVHSTVSKPSVASKSWYLENVPSDS